MATLVSDAGYQTSLQNAPNADRTCCEAVEEEEEEERERQRKRGRGGGAGDVGAGKEGVGCIRRRVFDVGKIIANYVVIMEDEVAYESANKKSAEPILISLKSSPPLLYIHRCILHIHAA